MSYDERQNITIIVPESILKEYTDHSEWCRYNNIVSFEHGDEMDYFIIDYSVVSEIYNEEDSKEPAYFNLQGMKVENPEKGIFIKVVGDKRVKVFLDK